MGEVGCEFMATLNPGDSVAGDYVFRVSDLTLPKSMPGDTLEVQEDGSVFVSRADGTPVIVMSAQAYERMGGRYV